MKHQEDSTQVYSNSISGLNNLGNTCFFNSVLQSLSQTAHIHNLIIDNSNTLNQKFTIEHNSDYDSDLTDHEEDDNNKKTISNKKNDFTRNIDSDDDDDSRDGNECDDVEKEKTTHHRSMRVNRIDLVLKESPGLLSKQLGEVIKSLTSSRSVVNPSSFFGSICKKISQYKGYQQQDSHELLRNLLDCVKTEELRRRQAAILETLKLNNVKPINNINSKVNNPINNLSDSNKKKIKRYGRLASYTHVDKVFGGHLLSSIVCSECNNCLQRVEAFLDLSLPINIRSDISNKMLGIPQIPARILRSTLTKKLTRKQEKKVFTNDSTILKTILKKDSTEIIESQKKKVHFEKDEKDEVNFYGKKEDDDNLSKHQTKKAIKMALKKARKSKGRFGTKETNDSKQEEVNNNESKTLNENEIKEKDQKIVLTNEILKEIDEKILNEKETEEKIKDQIIDESNLNKKMTNLCVEEIKDEKKVEPSLNENDFRLEAMQSLGDRKQTENIIDFSITLKVCLDKFTSKEQLSDKIVCDKCTKNYMSQRHHMKSIQKVYTNAMKQYLICGLPFVLTIHLKRFLQHGYRLEKSNKQVEFPFVLDMSPYVSKMCVNLKENETPLYSLYGIVEHSGKLNSGHYTAYVKLGNNSKEYHSFLGMHRLCHLKKKFSEWKNSKLNKDCNENDQEIFEKSLIENLTPQNGSLKSNTSNDSDKWYYVSDSHVSEVNASKVLKSQAYILFYQRIR